MKILEEAKQRQKVFLNAAVLIVALLSLIQRNYSTHETTFFERLMIDAFSSAQGSLSYLKQSASQSVDDYFLNIDASRKNRTLTKEILGLKNEIFKIEQVQKENERLKNLLRFGEKSRLRKVLAQVVAWDSNSDFRVLRINKGKSHGVELQSPVVTSRGVVGYIFRLTNQYADMITILDPNNRVDALVDRTRAHGIVEGFSRNQIIMKYLAGTEPVILGDLVLTSGLGNIYPKGLKIGKISRIERESYGISQNITLEPSVEFSRLEEVIVLVAPQDKEKSEEWKALDKVEDNE